MKGLKEGYVFFFFLLQVRQTQVESYCSMTHNLQAENLLQSKLALVLVCETKFTYHNTYVDESNKLRPW